MMTQLWVKDAKIGTGTRFFVIFLKFGSLVFLEIAYHDSLQQCLKSSRGFLLKNIYWGPKLVFFCHFLNVASLVFLDVAQDCSLGQCQTSSRAETSKKIFGSNSGLKVPDRGRNDLMLSSVHSNLDVLIVTSE